MKAMPWCLALLLITGLAGCGRGDATPAAQAGDAEPAPPTNRIAVPAAVRKNLGITFAKVETRDVARTVRIPGHFERIPTARLAYHATLPGQVEVLVTQYAAVKRGQPLFRIDSPEWRQLQRELSDATLAIRRAQDSLDAVKKRREAVKQHAARLGEERLVWSQRLRQLETLGAAGGGNASAVTEAQAQLAALATSQAEVVEEEVELEAQRTALETDLAGHRSATPRLHAVALKDREDVPKAEGDLPDLALARATAILGVDANSLCSLVAMDGGGAPRWRCIDRLEVAARQDGIVEALAVTNGAWIEAGERILETVDPRAIRFRAAGLQSDLGRLRDGMTARVLPPGEAAASSAEALVGLLAIGTEADPLTRKIDLLVTPEGNDRPPWARSGVSTEVEVVLSETPAPQLAIPLRAVIQDGLEKIVFRRDPKNADQVIRIPADLGITDGNWVVVESGLMAGDEVVHEGVYELMLASGSAKQEGGHFHADGTWHAGPDH